MTEVLQCDTCTLPIDQAQPFYRVEAIRLTIQGAGDATVANIEEVQARTLYHYHEDHVPVFSSLD